MLCQAHRLVRGERAQGHTAALLEKVAGRRQVLPEGTLRSGVWAWRRPAKEETGGRASCPAPIALLSFWVPIHSLCPVPALHPMALFIVQVTASKEGFRTRE